MAGIAEPGEEPIEAARRELLEETGYGNGEWRLNMVICANPGSQNNLTYPFIADGVEKISEQHLDNTEDVEVKLLDESEVIDLISSDKMKQALMAAPLWKYFATRK